MSDISYHFPQIKSFYAGKANRYQDWKTVMAHIYYIKKYRPRRSVEDGLQSDYADAVWEAVAKLV